MTDTPLDPRIAAVTARIVGRSAATRGAYLDRIARAAEAGPARAHLSCGNQAHAYAAMAGDKDALVAARAPNLGIVTAYNDMLSAHQPFERLPALIKEAARDAAPRPRWRAACRRCATGSPRARPAWNSRSSRAT
jgi:phosphogluconate dehydratase